MPIGDTQDGFFIPILTLIFEFYVLIQDKISGTVWLILYARKTLLLRQTMKIYSCTTVNNIWDFSFG